MKKSIQYLIAGASAIVIIAGMKAGADVLNPIFISLLLAVSLAPLPEWLTKKGLSVNLSITITLLLFLAVASMVAVMLANSLSGLSENLPVYEQKLTQYYNDLVQFSQAHHFDISQLASKTNMAPEKIVNIAGSVAESATNVISSSLVILLLIIFLVIEFVGYDSDTRKGKRNKLSMHDWLASLSGDLKRYISINAWEGLILAVMNYIFLLVMGVDFAFLWAFLSFFMNFVPNIGFFLSVIPPALVALIILGPGKALVVIIGYTAINFFVESVLNTLFMKKGLSISFLYSFLSMMVWGWVLGMPGAILGVPLTMVVMKIHNDLKNKSNIQQS